MKNKDYDYMFKLNLLGNSNVGKTAILVRYSDSYFGKNYIYQTQHYFY